MSNKRYIFFLLLLITMFMFLACSTPGESVQTQKSPHVHIFDAWNTVRAATCTDEGFMERKCTECGEKERRSVEKTEHTLNASDVAPTCDSQGYTVYSCKCGYSYSSNYVKPLGHTLTSSITAPTCELQGYTTYTCNCGYSYRDGYTVPLGHTFTESVTAATCTEQGHTHYKCESCNYEFDGNFIKPLGHSFSSVTVHPTATRGGYTVYTCHCAYSYTSDRIFYSDILQSAGTNVLYNGIDVSKWNHTLNNGKYLPIDWVALKAAGIDFVILKVGGKEGLEPTFEDDYAGAKAAGLDIGAYFYTYSTTVDGITKDAENVLSWIAGKQFEYPIYLDIEDTTQEALGKNILSEMCLSFIEKLQENGYYSALYTNHNWLNNILDTDKMLSLFDIWYARYPGTSAPVWDEEKYGRPLGMWQYTQTGTIDGFECNFDMNYAYKDYAKMMKRWGLNGF